MMRNFLKENWPVIALFIIIVLMFIKIGAETGYNG